MINNPKFALDGEFKPIDARREVRCLVYDWDKAAFSPDDVCEHVNRLGLPMADELLPKTSGRYPLLDIRVEYMTSFLWRLLKYALGMSETSTSASASNHAWGNLTFNGRKYLSNTQIPDGL
jgi:hypothetical protein